jgi:hypothetical protein
MFGIDIKRAADHRFRAKASVDLETVVAKLGEARTALADAEQEVRNASLPAALSDDAEAAMAAPRDKLLRAKASVDLLEGALDTAQRAERIRKQGVADAAEKSRIAAIRQHAAAAAKHGASLRDALADMAARFTEMTVAIGKAERLLKPDEIRHCFGSTPIELFLRDSVAGEFRRIVARNPNLRLPIEVRFSPRNVAVHGRWDGDRPSIDEVIRAKLDIGHAQRPVPPPVEAARTDAVGEDHRGDLAVAAAQAVGEDRSDESSADAVARYRAAVAAEQSTPPGPEQAFHEWDEPEPEAEISADDQAALTELLAQPAPAAPISAGARGLNLIARKVRK